MKNKLLGLACLLVALALLAVCPACASDRKPEREAAKQPAKKATKRDEVSVWMKKKLEFSGKILAALTKGDCEMIKTNAEAMQVVGYFEEWDRADLPEYKRQLRYFNDANKELIRQAEKKNINGATLAYTQMLLGCVHCHDVIRDVKKK
jgi:hypothetical protein